MCVFKKEDVGECYIIEINMCIYIYMLHIYIKPHIYSYE